MFDKTAYGFILNYFTSTITMDERQPEAVPTVDLDFLDPEQLSVIRATTNLEPDQIVALLTAIVVGNKNADRLKSLIDMLEIASTESAFDGSDRQSSLEKAMETYNFKAWLDGMGVATNQCTREDLINWWGTYMKMCGQFGQGRDGERIEGAGATGLWKATRELASKMQADPAKYMYLPPAFINDAGQVDRVLSQLDDPETFIEVLTGEAIEAIRGSTKFLAGFGSVETQDEDPVRSAIWGVNLALNRASRER
jgi:hypothetical protein